MPNLCRNTTQSFAHFDCVEEEHNPFKGSNAASIQHSIPLRLREKDMDALLKVHHTLC